MKEPQLMMAFHPIWAAKIINGEKETELRKNINYKWAKEQIEKNGGFYVNMYVNKKGSITIYDDGTKVLASCIKKYIKDDTNLAGYVVGRFWCDKVEKIEYYPYEAPEHPRGYQIAYDTKTADWDKLCKLSCLSRDEMFDYFGRKNGYALHVAKGKVEIFKRAKDVKEFHNIDFCKYLNSGENDSLEHFHKVYEETKLKKAPQSWCYVEGY